MYISIKQFWIVFFLFLLLPFSIHWKLLMFGQKTTGVAIEQLTEHTRNVKNTFGGSTFTKIQFEANGETYHFNCPEDVKYEIGKKVRILYNRNNPDQFVMFNFAGLVLSPKMYIPGILLIIWIAFYLSFGQNKPVQRFSNNKLRKR